jgi:hypothetical protein
VWILSAAPKEEVAAERDFARVGTKMLYQDVALRFNDDGAQ